VGFPRCPSHRNGHLDSSSNPETDSQTSRTPTNPTTRNSTDQKRQHRSQSPVPLHIVLLEEIRITRQIAVNTCQNRGWNLIESQQPTRHNLSPRLKRQKCQWDQFLEINVFSAQNRYANWGGHDARLYECGGDDDAAALEEEGDGECAAGFGIEVAGRGEEDAADEEEYDGDKGLEPAVGVGSWLS